MFWQLISVQSGRVLCRDNKGPSHCPELAGGDGDSQIATPHFSSKYLIHVARRHTSQEALSEG
jgi:hypothetical protein